MKNHSQVFLNTSNGNSNINNINNNSSIYNNNNNSNNNSINNNNNNNNNINNNSFKNSLEKKDSNPQYDNLHSKNQELLSSLKHL